VTAGLAGRNSTPISRRSAATAPTPSTPDPAAPTKAQPAAQDDSAESIVRQLFAVSITLASCAKTTDKYVASRVMEAIDELDHVISDLRTAIFARTWTPEPTPVAEYDELSRGAE